MRSGRASACRMGVPPHVIADNASAPTKSTPSPNQRAYVGLKKYAMMADLLGPTGAHR
jgi:hypothetical protein